MRSYVCLSVLVSLLVACGSEPPPKTAAIAPVPTPSASVTAPAPVPDVKRRLTIVMSSRPSGFSETTIHPDGTRDEVLEILQNGRGPKVKTHVSIAADGTVSKYEASGQNEMGTAVDEHFVREGDHAKWTGKEENGETKVTGVVSYHPRSQSVDAIAVLADALDKNGGKLALLPGGEARIEKVGDATAKGKSHRRERATDHLRQLPVGRDAPARNAFHQRPDLRERGHACSSEEMRYIRFCMKPMYLPEVEGHEGEGPYAEAIARAKSAGMPIPQIWHLFAFKRELGDALSKLTQVVMRGPSPLSPGFRELIAAFTSRRNQCLF